MSREWQTCLDCGGSGLAGAIICPNCAGHGTVERPGAAERQQRAYQRETWLWFTAILLFAATVGLASYFANQPGCA